MEKSGNSIMAVGAHPDDVEMGCGGTLRKHLSLGDEVYVMVLTNGEKGNHSCNQEECLESLNVLGIKPSNVIFGNFKDGSVPFNQEIVNFIEKNFLKFNINRAYTHHPYDRHQDHRNVSLATSSAARKIGTLLFFEGPSTMVTFEPHYFISITEEAVKEKISALGRYGSQIEKKIVDLEFVKSLAKVNGFKSNNDYAEAFAINHMSSGEKNV